MKTVHCRLGCLLTAALLVFFTTIVQARPWVLIDTVHDVAEIRDNGEPLVVLENLSFGRGGISDLHIYGDETTPKGEYHITRIDRSSRFHVFIALNYPTLKHLDIARQRNIIGEDRYKQLLDTALTTGHLPQNTTLGGYIGLHGLGKADPDIHERLHWTEGCVALTDAQIDTLLKYIHLGSSVVIR